MSGAAEGLVRGSGRVRVGVRGRGRGRVRPRVEVRVGSWRRRGAIAVQPVLPLEEVEEYDGRRVTPPEQCAHDDLVRVRVRVGVRVRVRVSLTPSHDDLEAPREGGVERLA